MTPVFRLIATDLDGTLLRSDHSISPRTRQALAQARAHGVEVVPVTARQPGGLRQISAQAGFESWALCSNGALCIHLGTGQVLFEELLDVASQTALARALLERFPDLYFVSVREAGQTFVPQRGYAALAAESDHKLDPAQMGGYDLAEVLAAPSLKFILRHPRLSPAELLAEVEALGLNSIYATCSGAPFVEVAAAGVTKAAGVARLTQELGIAQAQVLALGDAPNDAEMLAWAGWGVAMGNADARAREAANEVTLSNAEDGWAVAVERLLQT